MISPAEHVAIAEIAVRRKLGRGLTPGEIEQLTEDYKELSATARRPENTQRAPVQRTERTIMSEKVSFSNIMGTQPVKKVAKSANAEWDVTEFEIRDGVLVRVDPEITLPAATPDDATRTPEYRASNFLARDNSSIVDRVVVNADGSVTPIVRPFDIEPDITSAATKPSEFQPLMPGDAEDTDPRAMYSPSQPGIRPQGDAPDDMYGENPPVFGYDGLDGDDDDEQPMKSTKSIRLGSGYVFKRRIES